MPGGTSDSDGFAAAGDFQTPSLDELLRISISLSDKEKLHEAALQPSPQLGMSEEDKKWLLESMNGAGNGEGPQNDAERMQEALKVVMDADEPLNHKEYSLDVILFCIEDIDNALDFIKIENGLPTLLALLTNKHPSLRLGAAWLLGTLVQNNPKAQAAVFATGCLPTLIELVKADGTVDVRRKALLAVSSLVRGGGAGGASFIDSCSGFDVLCGLLADADLQLQKRAVFLTSHLLREAPGSDRKELALRAGILPAAGRLAVAADAELREFVLALLLLLLAPSPPPSGSGAAATAAKEVAAALSPALASRKAEIAELVGEEQEWAAEELRLITELEPILAVNA